MNKRVVVGLLALTAVLSARADEPDPRADFFTKVFVRTCMQFADEPRKLVQAFESSGAPELGPDKVSYFLGAAKGRVWLVPSPIGQFAVGLRADDQCSVFARQVEVPEVDMKFTALMATAPAPLESNRLNDARVARPEGVVRTQVWRWQTPGAPQGLEFTLITASEKARIQAQASLTKVTE